jgi:L-ribulokinase
MSNGFDEVYHPISENVDHYKKLYKEYGKFGEFVEGK